MLKSVSKALRSLVAGKTATDKPAAKRGAESKAKARAMAGPREEQPDALGKNANRVMTPERRKLIADALRIHRAKSRILDDLEDEEKRKLYAAAVKAFLHEDDGRGGT